MRMLHARWTLLAIAASTGFAVAATPATQVPNRPASDRLEEVIVTSTPLGGLELSATQIPGNVQQADSREIEGVRSAGLAQMLNQKLGSVFINEAQTNPLQPDVQFRGFVASPLLGQPEGMSVYQDGVRINDPFGDIVSWALVPESAISSIDLIPGSNPVFGLNTLGGALSIHTKSGFTDTGTSAEVSGGSFGRVVAEAESGGNRDDRLSYYASARYLNEDGWRQNSPSEALHLFGKTGWRGSGSELDLAVTAVDTDLIGNGPAPVQLLQTDRNAVYTTPDRTQNSLTFVTLTGSHDFSAELRLEGVTYYRRSDIDSLNGDESHFAACDDAAGFICDDETGEVTRDPAGNPIPASDDLEGATLNRSKTDQETVGVTLQLGIAKPMWERANRLVIGGTADRSDVAFTSTTELGHLDDNRQAIGG
ncbi:MAG TPA: TonB-dependent receptor plug domain-containing protein, partial [Povalibacter sp.]|nr:TonB-dependent receptor plug domain-containing protein [Povalibacter sp.]